jgi:hypothetical protein
MTAKKKPHVEAAREAREAVRSLLALVKLASEPGRGRAAFRMDAMSRVGDSKFDPRAAMAFVEAAEAGEPVAMEAVDHAIAWYVQANEPIPEILRPYLFEVLLLHRSSRKKKRGRHHDNDLRDDVIRLAVRTAMEYGLDRTRNEATEAPSACSIVADELAANGVDMNESNVYRIACFSQK